MNSYCAMIIIFLSHEIHYAHAVQLLEFMNNKLLYWFMAYQEILLVLYYSCEYLVMWGDDDYAGILLLSLDSWSVIKVLLLILIITANWHVNYSRNYLV